MEKKEGTPMVGVQQESGGNNRQHLPLQTNGLSVCTCVCVQPSTGDTHVLLCVCAELWAWNHEIGGWSNLCSMLLSPVGGATELL